MNKSKFIIDQNLKLNKSYHKLVLAGDTQQIRNPGQFIEIALDGYFLRRPFSVCDWTKDRFSIVYNVVGNGTEYLATLCKGTELEVLTGLGNGFETNIDDAIPLLIAGGTGFSPLYGLSKKFTNNNIRPDVVLGFNSSTDVVFKEEFENLGCNVNIATIDGSYGFKGTAIDLASKLISNNTYIFSCGPLPMIEAIDKNFNVPAQFSLEARMGCGFGACMGCSINTNNGVKRVCKDGPVFKKGEILW